MRRVEEIVGDSPIACDSVRYIDRRHDEVSAPARSAAFVTNFLCLTIVAIDAAALRSSGFVTTFVKTFFAQRLFTDVQRHAVVPLRDQSQSFDFRNEATFLIIVTQAAVHSRCSARSHSFADVN